MQIIEDKETGEVLIYPFQEMVHTPSSHQPRLRISRPKSEWQIAGIVFDGFSPSSASWNKDAAREIARALDKAIEIAEAIDLKQEVKL